VKIRNDWMIFTKNVFVGTLWILGASNFEPNGNGRGSTDFQQIEQVHTRIPELD